MGGSLIAVLVIAFAIANIWEPGLYRKILGPLCSLKENDLPPFPRAAAVGLLLFFGFVLITPRLLEIAGENVWMSKRLFNWFVATAFCVVGLGLAISPRICLRVLRWPQREGFGPSVVARIVGVLLIVGSALLTRSGILDR